jgi:hypothetical protein
MDPATRYQFVIQCTYFIQNLFQSSGPLMRPFGVRLNGGYELYKKEIQFEYEYPDGGGESTVEFRIERNWR